ncbi:MAG: hypothetical protein J5I81_08475, partial [Nitrococcus mobilis]|nr:hypothetical protein [Nitrococcus mobilis]
SARSAPPWFRPLRATPSRAGTTASTGGQFICYKTGQIYLLLTHWDAQTPAAAGPRWTIRPYR